MAVNSTVFKATLQIADMDRNYYNDHLLTVARHPSETNERLMIRLLAFALHANEHLTFANGLSESDEADIWHKDYTDTILLWIDVGLPDEKQIKKACGRAIEVHLYTYGGRQADMWWDKNKNKLNLIKNLNIYNINSENSTAIAELAERGMKLTFTIQDGDITISTDKDTIQLYISKLKSI